MDGFEIVRTITYYNTIVSIIAATILLLFILLTSLLKFKAAERLSYKLYLWISISDILYNFLALLHMQILINGKAGNNEAKVLARDINFCILVPHIEQLTNVWFIFLTTCLAYNLQTVFLRKKLLRIQNHWIYALSTLGVCIICYMPSIIYGYIVNDCYGLKNYHLRPWSIIYMHTVLLIPIIVCCSYCTYVFVKTYLALRAKKAAYNNSNAQSNSINLNEHMDLLAKRLMSYAIIPLITQFPFFIITEMYTDPEIPETVVAVFSSDVLSTSAGWLNFICFMFDPAIPQILYEYSLRKSKGGIFQPISNNSDNKAVLNGGHWLATLKLGSRTKHSTIVPLTSIITTAATIGDSDNVYLNLSEDDQNTVIRMKQM